MGSLAQRQISLVVATLVAFFLTYQIVYSLSNLGTSVSPEIFLMRIALCLAGFFFPILGAWISFRFVGGLLFTLYASVMVFFVGSISASPAFIWFLVEYAALCYCLIRLDQEYEDMVAGAKASREQQQNKKNDLDVAYRAKGEGISILFEKYSTYYNLRLLAEELSTVLSVSQLSQTVVDRCLEFIPRGETAVVTLSEPQGQELNVQAEASDAEKSVEKVKEEYRQGDLFDLWVIRNHRRLLVNDTHQDFRFDLKETTKRKLLRSLIMAPLFREGRVMGTLRMNAHTPDVFTNDDLRLLDTLSVLASSALSNAMLYEKTEELAIRDSLTGLYVRRYLFDRLKEEHRRCLLTKRPLSVLMCDLDHFRDANTRFGHAAGDLLLTHFAKVLKSTFDNGILSRYGGEEFSIILPETSKTGAVQSAERLRENLSKEPFSIRREKIQMTVSVGVATCPEDTLDLESLVQKADQALYQAKRGGRNQVCSGAA